MTLYKNELSGKVLQLQEKLAEFKITLKFNDLSFRDYLLMAEVFADNKLKGKVSIYYKPSKETFSLKEKINDVKIKEIIEKQWDNLNGAETYKAESGIYEAFVDGSYISGVVGYGAVIYLGDEIKAEISGTISNSQFRQFGGELKSVIETIKWCHDNSVKHIRINYDYQGIEKFVTGKWQPKNEISKEYVDFMSKTNVILEWRHIKSHTGNSKNDKADFLAKSAAKNA